MTNSDECQQIRIQAEKEADLIKKALLFDRASRYCKKNVRPEEYEENKRTAIELFQKKGELFDDPYEKSLYMCYEALCWICLKQLDVADEIIKKARVLLEGKKPPKVSPILLFVDFLIKNELENAQNAWSDIYPYFIDGIVELLKEAFITVNPSGKPPVTEKPLELTAAWSIFLTGKEPDDPEKDWTLIFYDTKEIFEEKLILKKQYMDDLLDKVKEQEHYHFIRNIRTVISSTGENLSDKALFIILATGKEKPIKFGILLGSLKDGGMHTIALWPKLFAQAVAQDAKIVSAFISRSIQNPEWFSDLNLLTFLPSDEEEKQKGQADIGKKLPEYYT